MSKQTLDIVTRHLSEFENLVENRLGIGRRDYIDKRNFYSPIFQYVSGRELSSFIENVNSLYFEHVQGKKKVKDEAQILLAYVLMFRARFFNDYAQKALTLEMESPDWYFPGGFGESIQKSIIETEDAISQYTVNLGICMQELFGMNYCMSDKDKFWKSVVAYSNFWTEMHPFDKYLK